ncbi:hypothetical protein HYDPIDRAFT_114405 [Hydnomerulius pinastri MD-312]|uniref:Uncharacterized protein n=1 Tax=Hydnomerulius pinastri MD-312 TaxID=994086 RepID=A0A0C9VWZ9_9AGAM|nr:hypothetical protein HYDPIDRAFT_114405 [Hydnomerulius pinastri MD-312]
MSKINAVPTLSPLPTEPAAPEQSITSHLPGDDSTQWSLRHVVVPPPPRFAVIRMSVSKDALA